MFKERFWGDDGHGGDNDDNADDDDDNDSFLAMIAARKFVRHACMASTYSSHAKSLTSS